MSRVTLAIEDYALLSNCRSGALVGVDGSIDWLCLPRYDSASIFGALLGDEDHGRWLLRPVSDKATSSRRYLADTFTLVTTWSTPEGVVEVTEFMPHPSENSHIIRRVRGFVGTVPMCHEVRVRLGYASATPWVQQERRDDRAVLTATAGPDSVVLRSPQLRADGLRHHGEFVVSSGEVVDLTLTWGPSYEESPPAPDVDAELEATTAWWREWASRDMQEGPDRAAVQRSLLVLRALTHAKTGGIIAAATTSLPEQIGGQRNWDYRYVWLRDASLTISVLVAHGYEHAVEHWRSWLLRAIAGDPRDLQIMYGIAGARRLDEWTVPTLPGYQGSSPVRVGNGAYTQYQADVIGEVMVALHEARKAGLPDTDNGWSLQRALMQYLVENIDREDQGIWEARGPAELYTVGRVMIWAALDSAISAVRDFGREGPVEDWERLRDVTRTAIEEHGFDVERGTYTQYFGSKEVDASLLLLPQVGYCDPDDPRMLGTVAAIEHDLVRSGLPLRYRTDHSHDGLPPGENPFLACGFWLVEQYARSSREDDARALMDQILGYANDVGLLSEEYDLDEGRQAGNTPQALTHLALIRAADALTKNPPGRVTAPTRSQQEEQDEF